MIFLILFISFLVLVNLIGLLFSRKVKIWAKRSYAVDSSTIFKEVIDFKQFVTWSPWSKKDPNMKQLFSEIQGQIGATYSWKGNKKVGVGSMKINEFKENESVFIDVQFGHQQSKISFEITKKEEKTDLKWSMEMDLGPIPVVRLFTKVISNKILTDFNEGLGNLAKKLNA